MGLPCKAKRRRSDGEAGDAYPLFTSGPNGPAITYGHHADGTPCDDDFCTERVPVQPTQQTEGMNATKLDSIVAQVPHKRHRTGVKPSRPGTYVQFNYACNKDCPRCQLEAYVAEEKQLREKGTGR